MRVDTEDEFGGMAVRIRLLLALLIIGALMVLTGCFGKQGGLPGKSIKPLVAVSIVPQETFVKAVAGDLVDVVVMIPPGKSPENYAPTPQEIEGFSRASRYFTIGIPAEDASILPRTKNLNKNMIIADTAADVRKVYPDREFVPGSRDPHTWMSPKRAKIMIGTIARELSAQDPANAEVYSQNADKYIKELDYLDSEIRASLLGLQGKSFIIYHPSLGYFADDYGLVMLALEEEGKKATPKNLMDLVDTAKRENIKVVFYQAETDSRQAKTFASEIGGRAQMVDPLSADYIANLRGISQTFADVLK